MHDTILQALEKRLSPLHARQRIATENDHHQRIFGDGINFFHPENWYSFHAWVRYFLKCAGLYNRGQRNARNIRIRENLFSVPHLPDKFDGFTILHISDPHVDMDKLSVDALIAAVKDLDYDLCVLTGDYRAKTSGSFAATLQEMERLVREIKGQIYGVLGNHDSVRMVPGLEDMGIQMLLNEAAAIDLNGTKIYLSGIDDAHYYQVDDIEKAAERIPPNAVSILLSHTPEIYQQAADANFDVMLCGHTHGGQICLPGGYPLTLDAKCPRRIGSGRWRHQKMAGYTSVGAGTSIVNVRLNCQPEVALHRLTSSY